jgi:hypothetical protein
VQKNLQRMITVITLSLLPACAVGCLAPGPAASTIDNQVPLNAQDKTFPSSWQGAWKGICAAQNPDGGTSRFGMELHVLPTDAPDRMTWTIVYEAANQRHVRPYEIRVVDAEAGLYRIDEKNSIVLEARLIGDTLHAHYSVGDALLTTTYRRIGDCLIFDLASSRFQEPVRTGGRGGVPEVLCYPTQAAQRAELMLQANK